MSPRNKAEPTIGASLRLLREDAGLTQFELGAATGYSERQIARWEADDGLVRKSVIAHLRSLRPVAHNPADARFSFIDLFAGIGGFRKGAEAAGGRCLFTSEWDQWAQMTYRANFGPEQIFGDITEIDEAQIPDHDILLAGFPCQPFSLAGVSKKNSLGRKHGFDCATQGTLFFDIERILAEKRPKAFILENVKNLASHDGGRTFEIIKQTLRDSLGYRINWRIIDARHFVPQHRERVFIVGLRDDMEARFSFADVKLPALSDAPNLSSILHPEDGSELENPYIDENGRVLRKYILTENLWTYLQSYAKKHAAKGNGFGFGLVGPKDIARTLSARYYKDGSEILIRRRRGSPRRLTPRECARLMGFDRPGRDPFRIVVSDTQAYRQFGNAVAVPVVETIIKALVPWVLGERRGVGLEDQAELAFDAA